MSKQKRRERPPPLTDADYDRICGQLQAAIERAQAAGKLVGELEIEYTELAEKLIRDVLRPLGVKQAVELLEKLYEETAV